MAISKGNLKSGTNVIYPRNSLDNIVKSVDSSTAYVTSGGKLLPEYIDTYTANLSGATVAANQKKIPTVSAVQMYVSTYTHSANNIPTSAINNFDNAVSSVTSSYVDTLGLGSFDLTAGNGISSVDGGTITVNLYTNNLTSATTSINKAKVPNVSAVQAYVSGATTGCVTYTNNTSSSLNSALQKKQDKMSGGFGVFITGGTEVSLARYRPITTIPAASTTVTLEPGEAYIIDATTTSKTLNLGTGVPLNNFGLESHLELFVANTGYIHTGSNVTLIDPLEPDTVNDCTVRFHDGHAIISVEDHVQAYMVQNTSTTYTTGTFAYGLGQTGVTASNYIGFRSELNTETVPTGGRSATNLKHIVGNGVDVGPTITGNLIIKSGATIRDIKTSGLVIMSGNAVLTNVVCSDNVVSTGGTATFAGSNLVENLQISSGKVIISSGAVVTITSGSLDTGSGTNLVLPIGVQTVQYGMESMTISHTAAISASAITSGCSLVCSTTTLMLNSATVVEGGAVFMTGAAGNRYVVIYNTGTSLTLRDTAINARISIAVTPNATRSYGTLILGGIIYAQDTKMLVDANSLVKGIVRIEDNTVIDITPMGLSFVVCQPVETLEIGSNCSLVSSGTTIPLSSGTYTSKGIAHDGTIS